VALARAHARTRLLESAHPNSLGELAKAEKIDRSYLGEMLRLTLLAPDIIEAILNGGQQIELGLPRLMEPFPTGWSEQCVLISGAGCRLTR
jgi:hypothetical protein